ncbi:Glycosyl transferase, family 2 [Trichormus variabilis ATCC 29413]|uniref:Glycosyl transferase, family 2 n=2 Tax=Anabaena variabilis TaxID=264691 RepID=Q3MEX2_TRIV2|nr:MULTISPECIES: glycosyltransferase family A protein [Nostocaceae]ABA20464.1 Glycosyl transferase, family 2 [Trichormus variabilis ATCC 29413]MBC1215811.1 glycosyltransferase family 2 protein [Trichormus variabilis ARAD]MBC1256859.1 glycosyltransferase family 2 protein [Trichormus variabilis V5]MBC1267989.1 glycosyltransferase family 2 protein [Trichormus variabilis FSR]MBC1304385.1 glycosyltransferase family 2 protein [Trichormus variabilis N2B]
MPKVSVVIPAYNAMKYLPATVESVLQQTFTDIEILIINDGSSDNIIAWTTQITDPRVQVISQQNQGLSGARNTGINHASGEYIAFIDADDLWLPSKLEKQVKCLDNSPQAGLVYTWTAWTDETGKPTGVIVASDVEGYVWEQMVVNDKISNGSSAMVRRICFDKVGLFDTELTSSEDRDMWIRLAAHYHFAVVKEPLTLYRRHSQSMSKNRPKMLKNIRRVFEKTFETVPTELLYLRNRSYGWINLYTAWTCMDEKNHQEAIKYRRQALLHYPQIFFTAYFLRLSVAIVIMQLLGSQGYDNLRSLIRNLRRLVLGAAT